MCRSLFVLLTITFLAMPALASDQEKEEDPRVALVGELLELTNVEQMMSSLQEQLKAMMVAQVGDVAPCAAAQPVMEEYAEAQADLFTRFFDSDEFLSAVGAVYVDVFSEEELRELVGFYRSPLGQKLIERTPVLMQRSMTIGQEFAQSAMPEIEQLTTRFSERLAEAGAECEAETSE